MSRLFFMLTLVIAGELVFGLPFHTARFFRPTMLDVFGITLTELGDAFAVYGIMAMLSYFPGGALADRYSARTLIATSLFATGVGGFYMLTVPGTTGLAILYGYWGVTTVFLLWGALLRATRGWGGTHSQGLAFGLLEGGRGLVSSIVGLVGVFLLAYYLPDNADLASDEERLAGFQRVVLLYTLCTFGAGILTLIAVPRDPPGGLGLQPMVGTMLYVAGRPIVWAQAAIIVCAYCTYKGLDNYALYATTVLGKDEVEAARLFNYGSWTRPVAALLAGLVVDRVRAVPAISALFAVMTALYFSWSLIDSDGVATMLIFVNFFATFAAVFALRGVYFVFVAENRTPHFATGAAIGIVSLVGYSPDIFFGPITGRILDANPGLPGFQQYFQFLSAIAVIGLLMLAWLVWLRSRGVDRMWSSSRRVMK